MEGLEITKLPDLPRVLNQKEAKFSERFLKWIAIHPQMTGSYEMKDSRGKSYLSFAAVEPQQVNYAKRINSDRGAMIRVIGSDGQPDYVYMRNAPAWIAINYPKFFCIVSINAWELEKSRSKIRSLNEERARQIATTIVEL